MNKKTTHSVWHRRIIKYGFLVGLWGIIPVILFDNFISYPWYYNLANNISISLTIVTVIYIIYLLQKEIIAPAYAWYTSALYKRVFIASISPFLIYFMYFANIVYLYPLLYTDEFGAETEKTIYMVKDIYYSNRRSAWHCKYFLKPSEGSHPFFRFCVEEGFFKTLPDSKFKVKINTRNSMFGYIVKSIEL